MGRLYLTGSDVIGRVGPSGSDVIFSFSPAGSDVIAGPRRSLCFQTSFFEGLVVPRGKKIEGFLDDSIF